MANSGHFDNEIDLEALEGMSEGNGACAVWWTSTRWGTAAGSACWARGGLVNLAAAEGHPASVMDMSFANQALGMEWLVAQASTLEHEVHTLPDAIDEEIARLKLQAMGVAIDTLTEEQRRYLASWRAGT